MRQNNKIKHKHHRWSWLLGLFLILLLIGGYGWYRNWQNNQLINRPITGKVTSETTRDTLKHDPIKPLSQKSFLHYRQVAFNRHIDQYPNGYLTIKRAGIQLPIYARTNYLTLALGVGKYYYLDSRMGQGNYVVAGHNMEMPGVLLSNLYMVRVGDKMAISNRKYVYNYRIMVKHDVSADVTLINGQPIKGSALYLPNSADKPLLTVYTCANGGANRLVVQGQLIGRQHK